MTDQSQRQTLPHVVVKSVALGEREKPEGRPLPQSTSTISDFENYLKRASAIGYKPARESVVYEKLKLVIAENNILVYDSNAVDKWLEKIIRPSDMSNLVLVWKPLVSSRRRTFDYKYQHRRYMNGSSWGSVVPDPYTKVIPEAVLTTAETVLKNFDAKDNIVLLVSDYEVVQPDPFLAAAVPGYPFLIIDFWDEPGFQPKAADITTQHGLNG